MLRTATFAAMLVLLVGCPPRDEEPDVQCGPGTELVNGYCLPIGNVPDDDDDDVATDDDDSVPEDTFQYGICNNLKGYENIVELHITPQGSAPLDEALGGGEVEWYACAYINLVPHTYTFRIVDEYGWEYGVSDLPLNSPGEFWFGYEHQL